MRASLIRVAPGLVPAALMLVAALIGAGHPVLSWDEVATVDVARRPIAQIWGLAGSIDGVFAPYYLLMHAWTAVAGTSELALRLPSILAMTGTVALAGELGRRLFGPFTGLVAGLILALMPNTSRYAAEARPYAFACFFALLAYLLLHRALDRPGRTRWVAYAAAVAALGLAHVVALTTLAAHLVALILRRPPRPVVRGWLAATAAGLLVTAPVWWLGLRQRDDQIDWVPPLTPGTLRAFPAAVVGSAPAAWLLLGLAVLAVGYRVRPGAGLIAMALGPIVALAAVSVLGAPMWVTRYLLVVLAPLALIAAAGLPVPEEQRTAGAGRPRPGRGAVGRPVALAVVRVAVVLALLAVAAYPGQRAVRGVAAKNGSDYRGVAALLRGRAQPGDGIVYQARSRTLRAAVDYYLRDAVDRPRDLLLARTAGASNSLRAGEFTDPRAHVVGTPRVWLLVFGDHQDPTTVCRDLRSLLLTRYRPAGIWHVHRATLALYVDRTTPAVISPLAAVERIGR